MTVCPMEQTKQIYWIYNFIHHNGVKVLIKLTKELLSSEDIKNDLKVTNTAELTVLYKESILKRFHFKQPDSNSPL